MACRSILRMALIAAVCCSPAIGQDEHTDAPRTVTLRGQTFEIYPPELLRAKGMKAPDIPRELNAAWVYVEAINAMIDVPQDVPRGVIDDAAAGTWPTDENAAAKLSAWLDQNQTALDQVRRATEMDAYYMPLFRGDSDAIIAALLPTLSHQRQLAKLLATDAARRLAEGDADGAADNYLTMQRMGNQVAVGSTLIEGLVGLAVTGLAEKGFMKLAESENVDADTLRRVGEEMDALADDFPDWETIMRAEQAFSSSIVDDIIVMPGIFRGLTTGYPAGKAPEQNGWTKMAVRMKRLFLPDRAVKKQIRNHYEKLIAATKHEDGTVGMSVDEGDLVKDMPAWNVTARVLLPSLARYYELNLRARSNFVRARSALAVAAWRKEHGRGPPSLAALVPEYLPEPPIDPMTGHELTLQPTAGAVGKTGIALVTRDMEKPLREQRKWPVTGRPRKSRWQRYADGFAERHFLRPAQLASVQAIVKEMETRANRFERSQADSIRRSKLPGGEGAADDLAPLDKMFREMKRRLNQIPTAEQKAAVEPG